LFLYLNIPPAENYSALATALRRFLAALLVWQESLELTGGLLVAVVLVVLACVNLLVVVVAAAAVVAVVAAAELKWAVPADAVVMVQTLAGLVIQSGQPDFESATE